MVTTTDPNGPPEQRSTFYGAAPQALPRPSRRSSTARSSASSSTTPSPTSKLTEGTVDLVLVSRSMHGWHNNKLTAAWLAEIHEALKPNGVLGVEQHRAKADANAGREQQEGLPAGEVRDREVEAAGFKLAAKSEVNANPKDTKDYAEGVWTLPADAPAEGQGPRRSTWRSARAIG